MANVGHHDLGHLADRRRVVAPRASVLATAWPSSERFVPSATARTMSLRTPLLRRRRACRGRRGRSGRRPVRRPRTGWSCPAAGRSRRQWRTCSPACATCGGDAGDGVGFIGHRLQHRRWTLEGERPWPLRRRRTAVRRVVPTGPTSTSGSLPWAPPIMAHDGTVKDDPSAPCRDRRRRSPASQHAFLWAAAEADARCGARRRARG